MTRSGPQHDPAAGDHEHEPGDGGAAGPAGVEEVEPRRRVEPAAERLALDGRAQGDDVEQRADERRAIQTERRKRRARTYSGPSGHAATMSTSEPNSTASPSVDSTRPSQIGAVETSDASATSSSSDRRRCRRRPAPSWRPACSPAGVGAGAVRRRPTAVDG